MTPDGDPTLGDLHRAITNGHLVLWYQPKIRLEDLSVSGAEALIRWVPPGQKRIIPPGAFLPLAEQHDLMPSVTLSTFDRLVMDMRRVHARFPDMRFSYNVSAADLRHADVIEKLCSTVTRGHVDATKLELELTETSSFHDEKRLRQRLEMLIDCGLQLAMDDFATGHSNLDSLRHLPVKTIKLDQGVVKSIWDCPKSRAMAWHTSRIALSAGLKSVAEGVEDAETLDFLRNAGFHEAQGWHIARPMPLADLLQFCEKGWAGQVRSGPEPGLLLAVEQLLAWRQMVLSIARDDSSMARRISRQDLDHDLSNWYSQLIQRHFAEGPDESFMQMQYARLRSLMQKLVSMERTDAGLDIGHRNNLLEKFTICCCAIVTRLVSHETHLMTGAISGPDAPPPPAN